jgi:hypothetical protein
VASGQVGDLLWLTLKTKASGTLGTANVISLQANSATTTTQFFENGQSVPDTLTPAPQNNSNSSASDPVDTIFNVANKTLGNNPNPTTPTFRVNDGSTQRSMVTSITVTLPGTSGTPTFSGGSSSSDPSAAFILTDVTTSQVIDPSKLTFSVGNDPNTGNVTVTITFTDASFINGSLADGRYTLEMVNSKITVNGAHPYGNDQVFNFYRMYGDVYGLGNVDGRDMAVFNSVYGKASFDAAFIPYLDFNGDGFIDATDLAQIRSRFGKHV